MKNLKYITNIIIATAAMVTVLNSYDGVNFYAGHKETYYNLPMHRVLAMAEERGYIGEYWERGSDGCKMYGPYIICAGHKSRYGEIVNTSLGPGIILDTGIFADVDKAQIDIATTW